MTDFENSIRAVKEIVLRESHKHKANHLGSCFSMIELLLAIDWHKENDDLLLLSKGHAVLALYALWVQQGKIKREELSEHFLKKDSPYLGHPSHPHLPQLVHYTSGSLGHGLSLASGQAYAQKQQGSRQKQYIIASEGELNCGQMWEAVFSTAHLQLNNIVLTLDLNQWQATGRTEDILKMESLAEKFKAANWNVIEIQEGNNAQKVFDAFSQIAKEQSTHPTVVLCYTCKGNGIPAIVDTVESHYLPANQEMIDHFIKPPQSGGNK